MNRLIEKELKEFPSSGWCKEFDEDILKYLGEKSKKNILKECKNKNNCGFAWQKYAGTKYHEASMNVWTVVRLSSKKEYSKKELREFVPTTTCIDTKDSIWTLSDLAHTTGKFDLGSGSIGVLDVGVLGDNVANIKSRPYDPYDPYDSYDYYRRDLERKAMREREVEQLRAYQVNPIWLNDDRISSMGMSFMAGLHKDITIKKDRFTQQETVLLKRKNKKRKLIFS